LTALIEKHEKKIGKEIEEWIQNEQTIINGKFNLIIKEMGEGKIDGQNAKMKVKEITTEYLQNFKNQFYQVGMSDNLRNIAKNYAEEIEKWIRELEEEMEDFRVKKKWVTITLNVYDNEKVMTKMVIKNGASELK
jgi:hypothetical protein